MTIKEAINNIENLCKDFNEGDLLTLSEITDLIKILVSGLNDNNLENNFISILHILDNIGKIDDQGDLINKILELLTILRIEVDNLDKLEIELLDNGEDIEDEIEENLDFSNFISDKEMLEKFFDEATEHLNLSQLELIELEYDNNNSESINTIFRAFHTIKGSAAFLGVKNIEEVSHSIENMLSMVRDGKIRITKELVDIIFYSIKFLDDLIRILPTCSYDIDRIINSYGIVKISPLIDLVNKIVKESSYKKIGEILEDMGKIDHSMVEEILRKQRNEGKRFGDILIEDRIVSHEEIDEAVEVQKKGKIQSSYVKVQTSRLNDLVDMVGELVVTQSMITQSVDNTDSQRLEKNIAQLTTISRGIKNIVLAMGMVPIGEIFNKLKIVIRNASRDLDKVVNVTITGDETELDRNLVEAIYDPLVHMVRNAVDHGIENSDERHRSGKPDVGKIKILAIHKGSGIEIIVEDDGRGIDREKVILKAVEKDIIGHDEISWYKEHEREAFMLLFEPGFSTKEKITELSGRGVGLDVVKKNLERVRGKIDIQSTLGKGSRFTLKLPLTLAIIDGFVTMVAGGKFIFPFSGIAEIIVPKKNQVEFMDSGEIILNNRGKFIPVFKANTIIRQAGVSVESSTSLNIILVINHDNNYYGIGVDEVIGKQEIVIKSLNEVLRDMELFSGGAIFGDGSIGFVVDIDSFLEKCR
jgi:two-component system, chemotaxis family, sensor kinase CheA